MNVVHFDADGVLVADKKLAIAAGGVEQPLSRVGDDPAHQRPSNFRGGEELA